ncbi:unnamed protein product [Prunus brigantina]
MRRHVKELHNEDDPSANVGGQKQHVCQDCGKKSNLHQHVKEVHLEHKPFVCSFSGCGMSG